MTLSRAHAHFLDDCGARRRACRARGRSGDSRSPTMIRLYKLKELPQHLQFNEYILTGYRPPSDFWACVWSTLSLHNETFNIFSHCITLLYFLARSSDYSSVWRDGDHLVRLFVIVDILTSTLPFLFSTIYHTFMPHHAGKQLYQHLLKTDIFGVWFATTFGSLSAIYVSLYCVPTIRQMYLLIYSLLSLIVLYYLVVLDCKRQRVAAFTIQFCLRSLIHLVRLTPLVTVGTSAFYYFLLMNIFSSIGALINALHIPECWFPGKCDYVLNGHSLMHIMAFLSLAVGRQGTLIDFAWLNSNPSCLV